MALNKKSEFEDRQQKLAELFKALGHPARVAILELLNNSQSCMCGDITEQLPLAQSTVSQHLKALKQAGLIKGEIDGVRTCYCIDESGLELIQGMMSDFLTNLQHPNLTSCC
ncbi:MAG TPA: transcriptional regulator [Balneolaceae bacterium]|nr:transcriptional regulator [Balneolaceae bacterium]|tara:strand:+ start:14336 stop:14671 length:336 start_codon:yes stop_codon:yes gene_type:complete